jgi:hypothetical protein
LTRGLTSYRFNGTAWSRTLGLHGDLHPGPMGMADGRLKIDHRATPKPPRSPFSWTGMPALRGGIAAAIGGASHLLIQLLTVAFPAVSEDELTRRSRAIARRALRSYGNANQLDSITVLYRERVRDGMWWIRHTRTFAVDSLKDASMTSRRRA